MTIDLKSPLCVSLSDIPETELVPAQHLTGGSIGAQIAYGQESSIMVATRQPGYHSKAHRHDAEQLNYVLEGELYIFVDDTGFLAKKGDVFRIPRNAAHWSWVQGDTPCVLLEVHTPSLIGDPGVLSTAVPLLRENDDRSALRYVETDWPTDLDRAAVERKVLGLAATE